MASLHSESTGDIVGIFFFLEISVLSGSKASLPNLTCSQK